MRRPRARDLALAALTGLVGVIAIGVLRSEGGEPTALSQAPAIDVGPVHVHGLGVDPADGALYLATHTGLFRVEAGGRKATRVGDRYQDTMAFTVVAPNRFLGSGHPDVQEAVERGLPPLLGLIESTDAGESWMPISLLGNADFHVLRVAGTVVYGYDATNDRLLASDDGGRRWRERGKPGPVIDLAVDPADARRLALTSRGGRQEGLFESTDGGRSWSRVSRTAGLLAWPADLVVVASDGQVLSSADRGRQLRRLGDLGGEPAALVAEGPDVLYAALHDGTIKRSVDGGATWSVRSRP